MGCFADKRPCFSRSMGCLWRSMGCFAGKIRIKTCHMVAKNALSALPAAGLRAQLPRYQSFLIFAHLPPTEHAGENIAFSVLKKRGQSLPAAPRRPAKAAAPENVTPAGGRR